MTIETVWTEQLVIINRSCCRVKVWVVVLIAVRCIGIERARGNGLQEATIFFKGNPCV